MCFRVSMALKLFSKMTARTVRVNSFPTAFSSLSSSCSLTVEHDRRNQRFTISPGSGTGPSESAVLLYRFTAEKEVDLMSTYVPVSFRGQGVAALLSQAAMDFLVEEKLKAKVSCWYIRKYIEEHPLKDYKELVIND